MTDPFALADTLQPTFARVRTAVDDVTSGLSGYASGNERCLRCYLTARDLIFNADGTPTINLSPEDPGRANWIPDGRVMRRPLLVPLHAGRFEPEAVD